MTAVKIRVKSRGGAPIWPNIVVVISTFAVTLFIALQPVDFLVRHLKDDSFYYLKTANNIALGLGSTFDGINRTNGYHPLWMLNLIPIYWLFPHSPLTALRTVMLVMAVYHTVAAWMLYRTISWTHGVVLGMVFSLTWALSPIVLRISLNGLESALYSLLLTAIILLITTHLKDNTGSWAVPPGSTKVSLVLGFLVALCMLARLDAIFLFVGLLATLGTTLAVRFKLRLTRCALYLPVVLPPVILVGSYLVFNFLTFRHLVPVSGVVKQPELPPTANAFIARLLWPLSPVHHSLGIALTLLFGFLVLAAFGTIMFRSRSSRELLVLIWRRYDWLWIGSSLSYVYNSLSATPFANWYYIANILVVIVSASEMVDFVLKRVNASAKMARVGYMGAVVMLVVTYAGLATVEFHPHKNEIQYEQFRAAEWIKVNLPPDAIGAAWNAGILAYFSGQQIVNLDGLVNSYEYAEAMKNHREPAFVLQEGVTYVFDMFPVPLSGSLEDVLPATKRHWAPYLRPYYEYIYYAYNLGFSSFFNTWFPSVGKGAPFVFKVWELVSPSEKIR
ncbi:MAG: hypothetical protein ACUVRI_12675 [Armatimonadota bacterium]